MSNIQNGKKTKTASQKNTNFLNKKRGDESKFKKKNKMEETEPDRHFSVDYSEDFDANSSEDNKNENDSDSEEQQRDFDALRKTCPGY